MLRAKHAMTKDVVCTSPDKALAELLQQMKERDIRHVPVVNETKSLVGIVSEGDILLRGEVGGGGICIRGDLRVDEVMSREVITCSPTSPLKDVAATMIACKIDCLPVVLEGKVVGIVTTTDILDIFCMDEEMNGHAAMPLSFSHNRRQEAVSS